jgi:hypothetical protein
MDDAMRARFVKALEAKGIHKGNWAEASVAVKKPNGRRLGKTYLRDAILRKKGKDEYLEWFCAHHRMSWEYVKFNRGPVVPLLAIEGPRPPPEEVRRGFLMIDPIKLIGAIEGVCKMLGASESRASRLAREVLAIAQDRELSD